MTEYEAELQAMREKTARLRALRLARAAVNQKMRTAPIRRKGRGYGSRRWTKQRASYKGLSLIIFAAAEAANQVSYAKRNHGSRVDTPAAAAELRQKTRRAVCGEPVSLKKPERYSATASRNQSIFCGVAALRCRLR